MEFFPSQHNRKCYFIFSDFNITFLIFQGNKAISKYKFFENNHFRVKIKYPIPFKMKVYLIRFFNEFQEFFGIY